MELLERASQLQALNSALAQANAGQGCVALVYGEAGIGKTSLVELFVSEHRKSWRTLQGGCDSLFTPRPLGPLHDIALQISSLKGTQGNLFALLDSEASREAIFSACLNELKDQSTIMVFEDIHWADEATLDLLKYLGRRIRQTSSLLILTYRDDELGADHPLRLLLGDLGSSQALHRIAVPSLSKEAVQNMAKGKQVDSVALHRLTNGNPFFVTEVLAIESGIPETVRDAVLTRAARLSAEARSVLDAAAVIGSRVEPWLLSEITSAESANIEECISRGMLQAQGDYYAFRHELARQTILESIPSQKKIALHRKTLDALKESAVTRENLARLAHHAEALNDPQAVLEFAPLAAWWASELGAHREAAALYELALRFAKSLPPAEHAQMMEAYGEEQLLFGQPPISLYREIVEGYRALGNHLREGASLARLALELHYGGYNAESEQTIMNAIDMLEALPPSAELAKAYTAQCSLRGHIGSLAESVAWGEKAIPLAEQFGDMETLARACDYAGTALLFMEDQRGPALLERSLAVGRDHNLAYAVGGTLFNWANALIQTFNFEAAVPLLQQGIAYTTQHDDDYHGVGLLDMQVLIKLYQGHWTEASEYFWRALQERDTEVMQRYDDMLVLARLGMRRGDADHKKVLHQARALSIQVNYYFPIFTPQAVWAEAAWLAGDHRRAIEEIMEVYDLVVSQHAPWFMGELAFWRWRAGDDFSPPAWIAKPFASQIAGDWREAAKEWEQRGCPYEQGMALMDGDEPAQLAALEIFERLGARPIIDILKQKMRAEGIRIPRGPRPATRDNLFSLTTREMEVLECLAKGLSNEAIAKQLSLSIRTVEHHIAAILQKMQVTSRKEAVALAGQQHLLNTE